MGRLSDLPVRLDQMPGQIATVVIAIRDLPTRDLEAIWTACDARKIPVQRMRFSLEDTDWRDRSTSVVRFPER